MNCHIREAIIEDAQPISNLIIPLTKKYVCPDCDESMHDLLLDSMSAENVKTYLTGNFSYHVAVGDDDRILGVVGVRDFSHLYHLFVHESVHGKGIARKMWEVALQDCLVKGSKGRFTVNSAVRAEDVYLRLGFTRIDGIRNRQGMVDIPMKLELCESTNHG